MKTNNIFWSDYALSNIGVPGLILILVIALIVLDHPNYQKSENHLVAH